MIILTWIRSDDQTWHALDSVRRWRVHGSGVYVVWYAGAPGRIVCLGQGTIAAELERVKADARVTAFAAHGPLLATWAAVSESRVDGVERYLAETWPPLIAEPLPEAKALEVNSPAWLSSFPDGLSHMPTTALSAR